MGILSGESFFDQMVDAGTWERLAHPRPENLEVKGFVINESDDPQGKKGLHAVGQTPDKQWWEVNHLSGACYQLDQPPADLYGPEVITACVMHNYHLISHLPEECLRIGLQWRSSDGHIATLADKLLEGYHGLRRKALRALIDLHEADNHLEWKSKGPLYAQPGELEAAQAAYQAALAAFQKTIEALQSNEHNTIDLTMPQQITREVLRHLAARILGDGDGIPANPNHQPWESRNVYVANIYVHGYCPLCGELAVTFDTISRDIDTFAPTDDWHGSGCRAGQHIGGRYTTVEVVPSQTFLSTPWQPLALEHVRSYGWPKALTTPEQRRDNYASWSEYDIMVQTVGKWPDETPPRCKYCDWIARYKAVGLLKPQS